MSRAVGGAFENAKRFPRVSGDEPGGSTPLRMRLEFSPRERG